MFGHRKHTAAVILGLTALAACTYRPSFFPMHGRIDDRSRLAGEWLGEFTSAHPERSGSIAFQFEPGRDSASGEVSVQTSFVGQRIRYQEQGSYLRASAATILRIRYVRASESTVEGVLEPYRDPECDCMVTTTFLGIVRGDSIIGEYVSRGRWTTRQGAWRMGRRMAARADQGAGRSPMRAATPTSFTVPPAAPRPAPLR